MRRETDELIELDLDNFFAPARDAFEQVFARLFLLDGDPRAAAKFLLAYDKMNWWQKDLLVLAEAAALDGGNFNRRGSEAMLEAHLDRMRKAVLYATAAEGADPATLDQETER